MALNSADHSFIQAVLASEGDPDAPAIKALLERKGFLDTGYKPSLPAMSFLTHEGARRMSKRVLVFALNYSWPMNSKGDRWLPQMYEDAYIQPESNHFAQALGASAWKTLLMAGSPDQPDFMECLKVLASSGAGVNDWLTINERGKGSGSLLAALATRGWTDAIQTIEKTSGQQFSRANLFDKDAAGEAGPIENALCCGHGPLAEWLANGADFPPKALHWAAIGFCSPQRARVGAFSTPSMSDRLHGLRMVARSLSAVQVDARRWDELDDPLRTKEHLAVWLMGRGAKAQAAGASEAVQTQALAARMADKEGLSWSSMEATQPEISLAGKMGEPRSVARLFGFAPPKDSSLKAVALWNEVTKTVRQRAVGASFLAPVLELLQRSQFQEASHHLTSMRPEGQSAACVALLGLAKLGYWDMPKQNGVGDDARHPLRWAGFKLALKAAGPELLDTPIDGLAGVTLMAMCSALGYADACSALVQAGARVDPDPLTEAVSPLALAIRFGHDPIAWALLNAGASPMEGAQEGSFGFVRKAWAIHEALDANNYPLAEAMIDADPLCAQLPNLEGQTFSERAKARMDPAQNALPAGIEVSDAMKMAALAERADLFRKSLVQPAPARASAARPGR
jgi:hypothetical protein